MGEHLPDEVRRARMEEAWLHRCEGWSYPRLSQYFEVSRSTVFEWCKTAGKEHAAEFKAEADLLRAVQLGQLDHIRAVALSAFEDSRKPERTVKRTTVGVARAGKAGDEGGAADEAEVETVRGRKSSAGNPAFLNTALAAMDRMRLVAGIDAQDDASKSMSDILLEATEIVRHRLATRSAGRPEPAGNG